MLIHKKDDIEFVTEFLCLLGHTVRYNVKIQSKGIEFLPQTQIF